MCNYRFYCINWAVHTFQSQSPPEQYIGDSVSFGQRVVSYPVNFVAGTIGDFFKKEILKKNLKIRLAS